VIRVRASSSGPVELVRLHWDLMADAGLQVEATSTPDRMLGRAAATFPVPSAAADRSIMPLI
jgi:hypothetical protein